MGWYIAFFAIELLVLAASFIRHQLHKKQIDKSLSLTWIFCLSILALTLLSFIPLKSGAQNSILYHIIFYSYGLVCILGNAILLICAGYLLRVIKMRTKMTGHAFIFFWVFMGFDALVFLTTGFTDYAYTGTLISWSDAINSPLYFYRVAGPWMTYHLYFSLLLALLIFISMILKCVSMPIVYAGKYITIGSYFLIISLLNIALNFFSIFRINYQAPVIFMALIPLLLYCQLYHYKPVLLVASMRKMVFDKLGSPVVLFDNEDYLADYNSSAAELFVLEKPLLNHLTLTDFLKRSVGNQMRERSTSTVEEVNILTPAGQELVYKLDYSKLNDKNGRDYGTLLMFHDISEFKKLYNSMERTAMTDLLTGLSSRVHLQKKITEINLYRKYPYTAVVCSISGINLITEGFGEDAGKAATMHVADLLRSQLRASDFAAYDDGNMIVLMPDTGSSDAEAVFNRISRILKHDRAFNFSLSFVFGIASRASRDADMQLTVSQAQADMLKNKMRVDAEVHKSIIDSLREALRLSAFETEQHSLRVQSLCVKIAEKLKLPETEINNLEKLALFHDIGKLSVPSEIINKPSPLTAEEMRIMQLHVINGYKIANVSEELAPVAREILCHHERWDGKGYPNGYAGEEIPYLSRIVTVADSFDVITHDRPYKFARPVQSALDEIRRNRGIQFDPAVVDAFLSLDFSKIKI